ncbi:hypothetical protein SALBM135S_09400 [Streptomyces alboniger]
MQALGTALAYQEDGDAVLASGRRVRGQVADLLNLSNDSAAAAPKSRGCLPAPYARS